MSRCISSWAHWLLGTEPPEAVTELFEGISQTMEIIHMTDHDRQLAFGSHATYLLSDIIAKAPGLVSVS